jgi:hypothetical protein
VSPPDDPAYAAYDWLEIVGREADGLDEGGPEDRVSELQEGDVIGHPIVEMVMNHEVCEQELSAVVWDALGS